MIRSVLLLALPLLLLPISGGSQDLLPPDFELAEEAVRRGEILPLADILQRVAAVQEGRVIEVELEIENGLRIYEVELITPDGRLLETDLNAATGEILSLGEDD
ncbi:PepSY domain-containing protein [Cereibacter sphaeroides]|uniref:PepSY domain-containing protein n=1 Tax=Cereibacter sphaeroides TaxID=1063 RepID=UPI001F2DE801|nr:PepSY domain-containing protein [Cereibacter sphaeroides]MCE6949693.1 PepSY domain-containing protein [Cereibacter sphaeroides]MCE6957805.1 PepSY domain-containing protein [Cereibacter sphaeroides]MCE6969856.1 PepSY domain-containing protein [Cereibacter sphaeroides]MCE6971699.1 PepSY domain-containing protein [Cereibacter sphaeroides]